MGSESIVALGGKEKWRMNRWLMDDFGWLMDDELMTVNGWLILIADDSTGV